jgi:hypothetical protein
MQTSIVTVDLQKTVRRLAGAATTKRQVADAVFAALRQSAIDPEGVSLDDMKSLVADAVLAAGAARPK